MTTAQSYSNLVQELYVAYFGRPADYFGLQNFESALLTTDAPTDAAGLFAAYSSNAAVKTLIDAFGTSNESTTLYASATTEGFVNAIYENLFHRAAANPGLEFWAAAIDAGTLTRGEAALAIAAGAQTNTSAQGATDWQTVTNKVAGATAFTADLAVDPDYIPLYVGAEPAAQGRAFITGITSTTSAAQYDAAAQAAVNVILGGTDNIVPVFNLTTGVDTFVGGPGNSVFEAILDNAAGLAAGGQSQTLNTGDSLTGGPLENTLNLTDFGMGGVLTLPPGITLTGMTSVNIASLEAVVYDFSSWNTVSYLNVNYSTGNDIVTVADNVAVKVSDTLGNVTINGGNNDTASTDAAQIVSISSSAATFQATINANAGTITDTTVGATVAISIGTGADTVTLGANAMGTITLAAHTAADAVVLGPSGASLTGFIVISGLNNAGADTITFAGETANTLTGFTQVTQAEVAATGANPAILASWVAAADGAAGSGITGGAHSVTWFQYQGQTFVLESVAGPTADAGTMAAANTLVELTGTGYTFAHASGANGTLHLLG